MELHLQAGDFFLTFSKRSDCPMFCFFKSDPHPKKSIIQDIFFDCFSEQSD